MSNPFEDENATYVVLVNQENQHSLWPQFADIPGGWTVLFGPRSRRECLDYIESHWTDLRPASLIEQMSQI